MQKLFKFNFCNIKPKSLWHDVSLNKYNAVIEIPRFTLAKYEMSKELPNNPIIQDKRINRYTKQEELRFYAQFPYFNYGFFPQTWEQDGDDDPLDLIELSDRKYEIGEIIKVNVLGAFCVIDQDEIDWKIICMNQQEQLQSVQDIENSKPDWFRFIKTFDGKKQNVIAYDGQIFGQDKAIEVIKETHQHWKDLKDGKVKRNEFWLG